MHALLARLHTLLLTRMHPSMPLVEVGISREALLHNFRTYQAAYPGLTLAPVLKSNAYGHDLGLVARVLDTERIAFFMVDSLYEARKLRAAGVRSRIVVMGYTRPEDIVSCPLRSVDFAITDPVQLAQVCKLAKHTVSVHLKFDTGMHRQGIMEADLPGALSLLTHARHVKLVGICSHFADADREDSKHATGQVELWNRMKAQVDRLYPALPFRHFAATKGIRFAREADTNIARVGIGLYGFDTAPGGDTELKPVLELRSVIGELRTIPAGESVGYNVTYTASRETRVATVPAGYYEGIDRRLSNIGTVLVRGVACPIIGRVSMNMTAIDVTDVPGVTIGDPVTLISRTPHDPNSIVHIAEAVSTPTYDESIYVVLVHIPSHLKRVLE